MRRLRQNETTRRLVRETRLSVDDLILPLFVRPGRGIRNEIPSMPGNYQCSIDTLVEICRSAVDLGIPGVILFGIPENKDETGSESWSEGGIVQRATMELKRILPGLLVITDVCLCEYTSHGHCGVIQKDHRGVIQKDHRGVISHNSVDNDATLKLLAKQALSHVASGADMVAPSDMMDGRVAAIRAALDQNNFANTPIMSYAAKYASSFYGPFRDAAGSTPQFGDRRGYQMDPANATEALREVALDIEEGADIVMVKPALAYLDIIYRVRERFDVPVAAYNVSGEFACIKAAGSRGWIDEKRVMMETLIAMKRAGADIILTYFAIEAATILHNQE